MAKAVSYLVGKALAEEATVDMADANKGDRRTVGHRDHSIPMAMLRGGNDCLDRLRALPGERDRVASSVAEANYRVMTPWETLLN